MTPCGHSRQWKLQRKPRISYRRRDTCRHVNLNTAAKPEDQRRKSKFNKDVCDHTALEGDSQAACG